VGLIPREYDGRGLNLTSFLQLVSRPRRLSSIRELLRKFSWRSAQVDTNRDNLTFV
jgi:hypothetical protein